MYSEPVSKNNHERTEVNKYFQEGITRLKDIDKVSLEQEITYDDIAKTMQELSNDKEPDLD